VDARLRDEQVLAFVKRFVADEGHLPTPEEVGVACSLRSRNSARPVLRRLEDAGEIVVDPVRTRLGSVAARPWPGQRLAPSQELAICEFALLELHAELEAGREALRWAPTFGVREALHREALGQCALVRAYDHARSRLWRAGVTLDPPARRMLRWKQVRLAERARRIVDWTSYCASSLAVDTVSCHYVRDVGWRRFPYLGPALLGSCDLYGRREVVEPRAEAVEDRLRGGDERLGQVVEAAVTDMMTAAGHVVVGVPSTEPCGTPVVFARQVLGFN